MHLRIKSTVGTQRRVWGTRSHYERRHCQRSKRIQSRKLRSTSGAQVNNHRLLMNTPRSREKKVAIRIGPVRTSHNVFQSTPWGTQGLNGSGGEGKICPQGHGWVTGKICAEVERASISSKLNCGETEKRNEKKKRADNRYGGSRGWTYCFHSPCNTTGCQLGSEPDRFLIS